MIYNVVCRTVSPSVRCPQVGCPVCFTYQCSNHLEVACTELIYRAETTTKNDKCITKKFTTGIAIQYSYSILRIFILIIVATLMQIKVCHQDCPEAIQAQQYTPQTS